MKRNGKRLMVNAACFEEVNQMEKLRELMYRCIEVLGLRDPITVKVSQRLDKCVVEQQKIK